MKTEADLTFACLLTLRFDFDELKGAVASFHHDICVEFAQTMIENLQQTKLVEMEAIHLIVNQLML
jgi:hypothetical protein